MQPPMDKPNDSKRFLFYGGHTTKLSEEAKRQPKEDRPTNYAQSSVSASTSASSHRSPASSISSAVPSDAALPARSILENVIDDCNPAHLNDPRNQPNDLQRIGLMLRDYFRAKADRQSELNDKYGRATCARFAQDADLLTDVLKDATNASNKDIRKRICVWVEMYGQHGGMSYDMIQLCASQGSATPTSIPVSSAVPSVPVFGTGAGPNPSDQLAIQQALDKIRQKFYFLKPPPVLPTQDGVPTVQELFSHASFAASRWNTVNEVQHRLSTNTQEIQQEQSSRRVKRGGKHHQQGIGNRKRRIQVAQPSVSSAPSFRRPQPSLKRPSMRAPPTHSSSNGSRSIPMGTSFPIPPAGVSVLSSDHAAPLATAPSVPSGPPQCLSNDGMIWKPLVSDSGMDVRNERDLLQKTAAAKGAAAFTDTKVTFASAELGFNAAGEQKRRRNDRRMERPNMKKQYCGADTSLVPCLQSEAAQFASFSPVVSAPKVANPFEGHEVSAKYDSIYQLSFALQEHCGRGVTPLDMAKKVNKIVRATHARCRFHCWKTVKQNISAQRSIDDVMNTLRQDFSSNVWFDEHEAAQVIRDEFALADSFLPFLTRLVKCLWACVLADPIIHVVEQLPNNDNVYVWPVMIQETCIIHPGKSLPPLPPLPMQVDADEDGNADEVDADRTDDMMDDAGKSGNDILDDLLGSNLIGERLGSRSGFPPSPSEGDARDRAYIARSQFGVGGSKNAQAPPRDGSRS